MKNETTSKNITVLELLGANEPNKEKLGIIREYQAWIHRRALDYLVVGLATDVDLAEKSNNHRYEAYLDTIESDLEQYRDDAIKWDMEHLMNSKPALWQTQYDFDLEKEVRRTDLPAVDVCEQSLIGKASQYEPTREEINAIAKEGMDLYFDEALITAKTILEDRAADVRGLLPTAPYECYEDGVASQDQLRDELDVIKSRLAAIDRIKNERSIDKVGFKPAIDERHTILDELRPVTDKMAVIGSRVLHIAGVRSK